MTRPRHLLTAALLGGILWIAGPAYGQEPVPEFEQLSIDRPDVSNLPTTVWPGHIQVEIGEEWDKGPTTREVYLPNMLVRTGLTRKGELRFGFTHLFIDSLLNDNTDDILFFSVGGKYRFVEEKGLRPAIAIQPEFSLPFGDGAGNLHDYANYSLADYSLILLFNNTLHKQVFINYNAGVFWSRNGRLDYMLSASASFLHTHRLGYFLEWNTLVEERKTFPVSADVGIMFMLYPRVQLDAYLGNKGVNSERIWFWGGGVGFRIDPRDMRPKSFEELGIKW